MSVCIDCGGSLFSGANVPNKVRCLDCSTAHKKLRRREYRLKNINKYSILPKHRFDRYKHGAIRRGYVFNLSMEDFLLFWKKPCYYCGNPIDTVGIDRKDNTIGYTLDNCVPCCKVCNFMKTTLSDAQFIHQCALITMTYRNKANPLKIKVST